MKDASAAPMLCLPVRQEIIAGLCFLPFYFLLLPAAVSAALVLLGIPELYLANLIFYILAAGIAALLFRRLLHKSLQALYRPAVLIRTVLLSLVLNYAAAWAVQLLALLLDPDYANANNAVLLDTYAGHIPALVLTACVLAPLLEECLFRGLIFGGLRRYGRVPAYFAAVLIFSAVHIVSYLSVLSPLQVLLSFLQYAPPAFLLCRCYERTDSLFGSMLLHALINTISLLALTL